MLNDHLYVFPPFGNNSKMFSFIICSIN